MTMDEFAAEVKAWLGEKAVFNKKYDQQFEILTNRDEVLSVLSWLKQKSFIHLAMISGVDWIKENQIELVYHVWSYEFKLHGLVKIRIDRDRPWAHTAIELWGHAQPYEQEIHEYFGVYFPGNPDLSSLYLHNWQDIPPLRKDFDPMTYSQKAYTVKALGLESDNTAVSTEKGGE